MTTSPAPNARRADAVARDLTGVRVLVVPTGRRAGPWACRSVVRAGAELVGAHRVRGAGGRSRWCPRPLRYPSPAADPEGFVAAVRDICRDHAIDVVLPAAEDTARVLAERRPELGGALVAGPDAEQYRRLCDKGELALAAEAAGVDHPPTVIAGADGHDGAWPALPSVVKPRISGEELGGVPAATLVRTPAERDAAVAALAAVGIEAIVQEQIDGGRWVGHCVRDGDGALEVIASRIEHDHPRGTGVASVQRTVPAPVELLRGARGVLDLVDYRGGCTISFLERDRRFYLHDVNLRLGASVGLVIRSGLDMPRRSVEVALGRPAPPMRLARSMSYVRVDGELTAFTEALRGEGPEPAGRVIGRVARAAVAPGAMLDPSPLDPFWLAGLATHRSLVAARRIRAAVRRPTFSTAP